MYAKESFAFGSELVGDEFRISLGVPAEPTSKLQVAYVLDADFTFGTACDTAYLLGVDTAHTKPPHVLVVGIGSGDPARLAVQRVRDFTPPDSFPEAWLQSMKEQYGDSCTSGGADKFLGFIVKELDPLVKSQFDVSSEPAAILGHSLGGLFALYCCISNVSLFDKYWIGSPAIVGRPGRFLEKFEEFLNVRPPRRMYLSVGSKERESKPVKYYAEAYDGLSKVLVKTRSVSWSSDEFGGETHNSVCSIGLAKALSFLFRPEAPERGKPGQ